MTQINTSYENKSGYINYRQKDFACDFLSGALLLKLESRFLFVFQNTLKQVELWQ